MSKRILIVDDDTLIRSFLATVLDEAGYRVEEARNGQEGLAKLSDADFDLAVTDLRMPGMSGMALMEEGRKASPSTRWIVITAFGSIGSAVEAMKAGASDYLTKPLKDPEELRRVVRRVLKEAENETRISLLTEELGERFPPVEMIFLGDRMTKLHSVVRDVSATNATVHLTGASGTGKELIARVIHNLSPRRGGPFIAVHCAALSESLLESELFGHERGAFTGAVAARKGRFELADGGTVFLDEIGDLSPAVQVKLLRVFQEREFERVGGSRSIRVDVRIITATHRDLKAEVAAGKFREDLFYRVYGFPIALPSLSERREAILPLAEYFLEKIAGETGVKPGTLSTDARAAMLRYAWPGNIRELQNVMERAAILAHGEIDAHHLGLEPAPVVLPLEGTMHSVEREAIRGVLAQTGGNRKEAARVLGISLRTLQYRIKEYGL